MAQEARQLDQPAGQAGAHVGGAGAGAWHNHLPGWIRRHEIFTSNSRRNQTSRAVLQVIADACDPPDVRGDLLFAIGGRKLASRAGVHLGTFWRHVARLEQLGLIVTLSRGGQLGGKNIANTYGVPGAPGSLDHRRARRREQIMKRDGTTQQGRPRYVPEVVQRGQQATLYPDPHLQQQVHQRRPHVGEAAPAPPSAGQQRQQPRSFQDVAPLPPWRSATTPVAQRDASISIETSPGCENHGAGATDRRDGARSASGRPAGGGRAASGGIRGKRKAEANAFGGPCIRHIEGGDAVLGDTPAMRHRYRSERARGAVRMSELNWLAIAEKALRVVREEGGSAVMLFAAIVNRELYAFVDSQGVAHVPVSEVDEQRARQRIKAASSDEHVLVQAALQAERKTGHDAFRAVQSMRPGAWTRERFDRVRDELQQVGAT